MDAFDEVGMLTDSSFRLEALRAICTDGQTTPRELDDDVDASRRTITRTLATLEDAGYLVDTTDGHRLTAKGRYVFEQFDTLSADFERVADLEPFLRHAPADVVDIDPRALADAEVLVAAERSPWGLLDRVLELRSEATKIREYAPGVEAKSVAQLADQARSDQQLDVEVIIPQSAIDAAETHPGYGPQHAVVREADEVDFYVHPNPADVFLGILDDTVAIAVSRDGRPHVLVLTDDQAARSWARETFTDLREAADPLDVE